MDLSLEILKNLFSFAADVGTVLTTTAALYLFLFKQKEIKTLYKTLLNYTNRATLSELSSKIDKVRALNFSSPSEAVEIQYLLHDIIGQIAGNKYLKASCKDISEKTLKFCKSKKSTESEKRKLVSEITEHIKTIDIDIFSNNMEQT